MSPIGARDRPAVGLEEGALPGAPGCPACGKPLFAWIEVERPGGSPRVIDRCESCGLAVARDALPISGEVAAEQLVADAAPTGTRGEVNSLRLANAASVQAWLGAENWAGLELGGPALQLTTRSADLLLPQRGLRLDGTHRQAGLSIASMWQTILNLLTFNRDFAREAATGRLRPRGGRGSAAFALDAAVTVLAAVPVAVISVLIEVPAILAGRGGYLELRVSSSDSSATAPGSEI
jgi:hypothetical protein